MDSSLPLSLPAVHLVSVDHVAVLADDEEDIFVVSASKA